jgi:hypothetical protein
MSSYAADIADAIRDAINAGIGSSADFEAERVYVPERDYATFAGTECKVIMPGVERTRETRATVRKDLEVNIIFASKLDGDIDPTSEDANETLDALNETSEQIADAIALGGPYADGQCLRVETDPIYDFEILRSHRVFVVRHRAFVMFSP